MIIAGVEQDGTRLIPVGLRPGDDPPDVTELNKLLGKYFSPQPIVEVAAFAVDGKTYGVVIVPEFPDAPHICTGTGNDEKGELVIREGDVYRRSDRMECARADPRSMSGLIDSAITKRGGLYRSIFGVEPPGEGQSGIIADVPAQDSARETQRAVRIRPVGTIAPLRLGALQRTLGEATVRHRFGDPFIPRGIDLVLAAPNEVMRTPEGLAVERSAVDEQQSPRVALKASRELTVGIRETLWEDFTYADTTHVDFSALLAFVTASLVYAKRLYGGAGVEKFEIAIGILKPLGRTLTTDLSRFGPFLASYVATSPIDLWTAQLHSVGDLDAGRIKEATRTTIDELMEYFGFQMKSDSFEGQFKYVREGYFGASMPELAASARE